MLTGTSELALRTLVLLALEGGDGPVSPRQMAGRLDASPSYLAKVTGALVNAGILRSIRGAHGGVLLARPPDEITLLSIIEASQGLIVGNYCAGIAGHMKPVCSFHQVMQELHAAMIEVLSRWTLSDLLTSPANPDPEGLHTGSGCKMRFDGCEKFAVSSNDRPGAESGEDLR
jgi:Rrf2 family protein